MQDGRLYDGNPYCFQPPLVILILLALAKTVGYRYLDIAVYLLIVAANTGCYIILEIILSKMRLRYSRPLFAVLFLFLVTANTLVYFEAILSSFFLIWGYYLLYYSEYPRKTYVCGVLFFLSLASKVFTLPIIAIILIHYLYTKYKDTPRESRAHLRVDTLAVPLTIVLLTALTMWLYPNLLAYNITAHILGNNYDAYGLMNVLFSAEYLTKLHLALFLTTLYLLYLFIKFKDLNSLVPLAFFPIFVRQLISGGIQMIYGLQYTIPFHLFLIIAILRERDSLRRRSAADWASVAVIVILLAYGSFLYALYPLSQGSLSEDMLELQYGMSYLPNDGKILTGYNNRPYLEGLLSGLGKRPSDYDFDYVMPVPDTIGFDVGIAGRMHEIGVVKNPGKDAEERINPDEAGAFELNRALNDQVSKRLSNAEYSAIIYGPPDYNTLNELLKKIDTQAYRYQLAVPNGYYETKNGAHMTLIFFKDNVTYQRMRLPVVDYYLRHFSFICSKSRTAAFWLTKYILPANGVSTNASLERCNFDGDYFKSKGWTEGGASFTPKERISQTDLIWLATILVSVWALYLLVTRVKTTKMA
jgi:hypothetical protein